MPSAAAAIYSTNYNVKPVPEDWLKVLILASCPLPFFKLNPVSLQAWTSASPISTLHLPLPNKFIPTDFALAPPAATAAKHPALLLDTDALKVAGVCMQACMFRYQSRLNRFGTCKTPRSCCPKAQSTSF